MAGEGAIRYLIDIARAGLVSVTRYPLRSAVSIAALIAVLVPYLAGLALAKGVEAEAEAAARAGPDLYVRGSRFGRSAPLPLSSVESVSALGGVNRVTPRIVGEVSIGADQVRCVLIGMPVEHFPSWADSVEGRPPTNGGPHQLVIGTSLARRLGLRVGSRLPPFYRNDRIGERVSEVVGVFTPDAPLWQSYLILTTLETAAAVFEQPGLVTDLLVDCSPGTAADLGRQIAQRLSFPDAAGVVRAEVTSADELVAGLPRAARHREGVFNLYFVVAFAVGILVLLVTSGAGLSERRREVGILKATGWQTDEVLLRSGVESLALSLSAACLSLLLAWVWLRLLNGYGLAGIFLPGADWAPDFRLPFRLTPVPLLLGFVVSLVVVLTGTLPSTWRAAVAPPRVAMR